MYSAKVMACSGEAATASAMAARTIGLPAGGGMLTSGAVGIEAMGETGEARGGASEHPRDEVRGVGGERAEAGWGGACVDFAGCLSGGRGRRCGRG